jgi:DNA-binding PadR family transcriptional regulator
MSTRLVILGLLREQDLHGYELKQRIEERMGDWTEIAFGSIYFALGKLAEEGFVEKVATEQQGNRPSRDIYRITPEGREEFLRLLRENWTERSPQRFDVDIGLYFAPALGKSEIIRSLQARLAWLERILDHLQSHRAETLSQPEIPADQQFWVEAIFAHALSFHRAERDWVRNLLATYQERF